MEKNNNGLMLPISILFSKPFLNFIMVFLGMAAAYFTTINSLKIELADKAESAIVNKIDQRLARLEVSIIEGSVSKDEFFEFSKNVESRLSRIEYYMSEQGR